MLFTFPSRYWFTIASLGVFSLGRWSSQIPTEFHVFRRTQDTFKRERSFDYGLLPSTTDLSRSLRLPRSFVTPYRMSYNPKSKPLVWAMFRFARRYSGNRICFSSSRYLDVSVPWVCLPYPMYSDKDTIPRMVGFPIRKSSIKAYLQLPEAYRR